MPSSILIVDDEKHTREGLRQVLQDEYEIYLAANAEEAFNLLDAEPFDVVLTDLRMAGKGGLSVIDRAIRLPQIPIIVMMTAYGNVETAVEAIKRGAKDFLSKPVNLDKLEYVIKRELKTRKLEEENVSLHKRLDKKFGFDGVIGKSTALREVIDVVEKVAPTKATVLLQGPTGTGKELFAQAIHQNSGRSRMPFVPVDCAALPETLLESELFGHEKGAFTGAASRRIGRFEAADGGTLFIDEIGDINTAIQVKLLRVLETRTFARVGSVKPISVDVRLIVASNRNLEGLVKNGSFREDLFYRLNVVPITLPSLAERSGDIPLLLEYFIVELARENGTEPVEIDSAAMQILRKYPWPGNIRELRNLAENLVVLKRGGRVTQYDLDPRFLHGSAFEQWGSPRSQPLSVEENEKRLLRNALIETKGNRTQAAGLLGISRRTLHRKLRQHPELDVR